jgi:cytochrome c oxidase cbb3-type subunit 3
MSDFLNDGWSIFIAAATLIGLVACLGLLAFASRRHAMADDNSTGHVFDGDLKEMNNPLPRWWMVLFVVTVVFSFAYLWVYPGLGSAAGSKHWTSRGEHADEVAAADAEIARVYAAFKDQPAAALAKNPKAMGIGERLFINNCAACHGSDARGSKGFPDLTDSDWLHGGSPEKIEETITGGRIGTMPPMAAAVGTPADVHDVAHYVLSLSGSAHDSIAAARGRSKFTTCAACHGADGKGNTAIGSANLTDKVWLHGWGEDAIVDIVTHGKTNVMPPQQGRLTPDQIHVLASYVWNLSQPRQNPAP